MKTQLCVALVTSVISLVSHAGGPMLPEDSNSGITIEYFEKAELKVNRPERPINPINEQQRAIIESQGKAYVMAGIRPDRKVQWIKWQRAGKTIMSAEYAYGEDGQPKEGRRTMDNGVVKIVRFDDKGRWVSEDVLGAPEKRDTQSR